MKTIGQIANELDINKDTLAKMILRKNIQPDGFGKKNSKLYGEDKEKLIKQCYLDVLGQPKTIQDNQVGQSMTSKTLSQDNIGQSKIFNDSVLGQPMTNKTTSQDNTGQHEIQSLTSKIEHLKLHELELNQLINDLKTDKEVLLKRIEVLEQTNSDLLNTIQGLNNTLYETQKTTSDTIQALKNAQILHAETLKSEILALNEHSTNNKNHWWEFWKK